MNIKITLILCIFTPLNSKTLEVDPLTVRLLTSDDNAPC
jgi:hypothetical protein